MHPRQRSIDRIGSLPDDILCHILSFLPTKTSVATSILSTRWSSIWAHVPTLDFHFNDYGQLTTGFSKIIDRVVSLHKFQAIDTLRVNSPPNFYKFEPETFIVNAKFHKLRNLVLCLGSPFTPTRHLLTCTQTLVTLRISCFPFIYMMTGDDVCLPFPHLKELSLGSVRFQADEDLPRFLSGCPVLEDLTLNLVFFEDKISGCFNVSSPALKRLHVHLGDNTYFSGCRPCFRVEINAPALTYLSVDFMACNFMAYRGISVSPMTSLIEADIKIRMMGDGDGDDYDYECYVSMLKFLGCLRNVKCLRFNGIYDDKFVDMMVLDGSTVRFDNLTKLVYGSVADWRLFVKFLEIADNLQVLVVVSVFCEPFGVYKLCVSKPTGMIDGEEVRAYCLSSNLKSITIYLTDVDTPEEGNTLRYLLEKAKVVEKMEIYLRGDPDAFLSGRRSRLVKFLSSFVRGSKGCKDIIMLHFRP